jgi:hypothetical protein
MKLKLPFFFSSPKKEPKKSRLAKKTKKIYGIPRHR